MEAASIYRLTENQPLKLLWGSEPMENFLTSIKLNLGFGKGPKWTSVKLGN